ncbi:MAG: hypothetical protein LBR22_00850 [Desulfovibrio sp.]|jgi:hypothetical protein|nr:hypothetical protein [Desulfovibrio sp.]
MSRRDVKSRMEARKKRRRDGPPAASPASGKAIAGSAGGMPSGTAMEARGLLNRLGWTVENLAGDDRDILVELEVWLKGDKDPAPGMLQTLRRRDAEMEARARETALEHQRKAREADAGFVPVMLFESQEEYAKWYGREGMLPHVDMHNAFVYRLTRVSRNVGLRLVHVSFDAKQYQAWLKEEGREHSEKSIADWMHARAEDILQGACLPEEAEGQG